MDETNPHPRISADPEIMVCEPCIAGTRITVEVILRLLAAGASIDKVLEGYPRLMRQDALAALRQTA